MRNSREICRQKWLLGRAHRAIAESVGVSLGVVSKTLQRASAAGLTWEAVEGIEDQELERRLYPHAAAESERPEPDCVWVHRERHRPGVTLELLHHEYLERHPNGLRYTAFCDRYREWMGRRGLVMRQVHAAGDKAFIDYSGKRPRIVDAATGEVIDVGSSSRCLARRTSRTRRRATRSAGRTGSRATCERWSISAECPLRWYRTS